VVPIVGSFEQRIARAFRRDPFEPFRETGAFESRPDALQAGRPFGMGRARVVFLEAAVEHQTDSAHGCSPRLARSKADTIARELAAS
jgi:hypothetical protein